MIYSNPNPTLMLWNQLHAQYIRNYDKRVEFCRTEGIDIYTDKELFWIRKKIDLVSETIDDLDREMSAQ